MSNYAIWSGVQLMLLNLAMTQAMSLITTIWEWFKPPVTEDRTT